MPETVTERRVEMTLGVVYQTPREKMARIPGLVREIIEARDQVRFDRVHFKEFGPHSLIIEAVFYILSPDYALYLDIRQAINLALMERFEQENIQFAYPTHTILLDHPGSEPPTPS